MPCDSSHMEPSSWEIEMTKVVLLLDEVAGNGTPDPDKFHDGYDNRVYSIDMGGEVADRLVRKLCTRIKKLERLRGLDGYSFELRMWWRDHQKADRVRESRLARTAKERDEKRAALAKLTRKERKLLNV